MKTLSCQWLGLETVSIHPSVWCIILSDYALVYIYFGIEPSKALANYQIPIDPKASLHLQQNEYALRLLIKITTLKTWRNWSFLHHIFFVSNWTALASIGLEVSQSTSKIQRNAVSGKISLTSEHSGQYLVSCRDMLDMLRDIPPKISLAAYCHVRPMGRFEWQYIRSPVVLL